MDNLKFALIGFICGAIGLFIFMFIIKTKVVALSYPSRKSINDFITENIESTKAEQILSIYDSYTKDRKITRMILDQALTSNIPVNLFFALCKRESNFKVNPKKRKNRNGSYDLGLFQLNSFVYKKYSDEELIIPLTNIHLSSKHLTDNFKRYNNWNEAVIAYNCGNTNNVPSITIKYLSYILEAEAELDQILYERFK